ncbi:MAG TPA: hypothetical protein VM925_29485 [Labilithrix sp.]|nr:hypothetical protein [Labilithrix sp.]
MTNQQSQPQGTFTRQEVVDKPGIIGARWWQESIATQVPRRQAMTGLLALGGVLAAMAAIGTCAAVASKSSSSSEPDVSFQPRAALDMQKESGWDFGATGETLVFDGKSTQAFDRTTLARMLDDLAPADGRYAPFFVPTLFQSPSALPKTAPPGETPSATFVPLKDALVPISTPAMETAFQQGKALASLLERDPRAKDVSVVVDLPGPEAVAFAAGASGVLDPVFLFDNWPHPRGVVPAHLTLAAAAYYQPMFAKAKTARAKGARPMFVLDRKRLASYTDDASQFDNRHVSRLPSASNLASLGTKNILYVAPNAVDRQELDDLADDFLALGPAKTGIKVVPATAFEQGSAGAPSTDAGTSWDGPYFYGGSKATHPSFWTHWSAPPSGLSTNEVQSYTPTPRTTPFSSGTPTSGAARPRPTGFGMVPVAVAVGTGVILGAKLNRNGSWNRTTSTSSGS